eukprot:XP_001694648.1 predicted protein [Chlamydomonas reinhardtii]
MVAGSGQREAAGHAASRARGEGRMRSKESCSGETGSGEQATPQRLAPVHRPASPEPRQPQQAQSSSTNGSGSKGSTARGRSGRHAAVASATVAAAAVGTGATAVATAFQPEAQSPQRSRQRRLGSREETPGEGDGGVAVLAVPEEAWVVERAGETDVTAQPSTSSSGSSSTGSAVRRNGRAIASYTDDLDDVTVALPLVREAAAAGLQSASGFGARPQRKRLLQLFPVPRPHRRKREALARAARAAALAAATAAAARQEADAGRAAAAVVDSRESLSAAPNGSGSIKRRRRGLHSTEAAAAAPSALDPGCSSPQDRSQVPGWSGAGRGHSGDGWADSWVDGAAAAGSFGGRPGRRRFSFPFTVSRTSDTPIRTLTPTRWLDPLRAATSGHSLSAATAQAARVPSAPPAEAAAPSAAAALAQRPAGSDDGTAAPAVSWDVATQAAPAAAVAESSAGSLTPPPALVELEQAAAPTARRRPSTSAASLAAVPFELPSASAAVRQPYALAVKPPYVLYAVESPGHRYVVYRYTDEAVWRFRPMLRVSGTGTGSNGDGYVSSQPLQPPQLNRHAAPAAPAAAQDGIAASPHSRARRRQPQLPPSQLHQANASAPIPGPNAEAAADASSSADAATALGAGVVGTGLAAPEAVAVLKQEAVLVLDASSLLGWRGREWDAAAAALRRVWDATQRVRPGLLVLATSRLMKPLQQAWRDKQAFAPQPDVLLLGLGTAIAYRVPRPPPPLPRQQHQQPDGCSSSGGGSGSVPAVGGWALDEQWAAYLDRCCDAAAVRRAVDAARRGGTRGEWCSVDVIPAAAGKAAALSHVLGRFGIAPAAVVAAGDTDRDAELLAAAGAAVVTSPRPSPALRELLQPRPSGAQMPAATGVGGGSAGAEATAAGSGVVQSAVCGPAGVVEGLQLLGLL